MSPIVGYIRRFGLFRGLRFYRVAQKCERDPRQLRSSSNQFRAWASDYFYHANPEAGRAYLAFAEILQVTHDKLVLGKKKSRQPLLAKRARGIEKRVRRRIRARGRGR